jgi:hypothetical protein
MLARSPARKLSGSILGPVPWWKKQPDRTRP